MLNRDRRAFQASRSRVLPFAVSHHRVGVDGAAGQFPQGAHDPVLRAGVFGGVPLQGLGQGAGPGLRQGGALAGAPAAQIHLESLQVGERDGAVGPAHAHLERPAGARRGFHHGHDADDGAHQVAISIQRRLGRHGPVAAAFGGNSPALLQAHGARARLDRVAADGAGRIADQRMALGRPGAGVHAQQHPVQVVGRPGQELGDLQGRQAAGHRHRGRQARHRRGQGVGPAVAAAQELLDLLVPAQAELEAAEARDRGGRAGRKQGADPELPADGPEHHPGQARVPGRGGPVQQIPAQVVVGDRHLQVGGPGGQGQAHLLQAPEQRHGIGAPGAADPHRPGTQGHIGRARVQPQARPVRLPRRVQPRHLVRDVSLLFQELQDVVDLGRPRRSQRGRDLLRRPGAVQQG